jgi:hypothetical protein
MSQAATANSTTISLLLIYSHHDAIVLGGTDTTAGAPNGQFSGYGTVIDKCFFKYIRRAVFLRYAANGVTVRDNGFDNTCAAGFSFEAAVDLDGTNTSGRQGCGGCTVADNYIALDYYTNGVRLNFAAQNTVVGNYVSYSVHYFGQQQQSAYLMTAGSSFNLVMGGQYKGSITDQSSPPQNTIVVPYPQSPVPTQAIFSQPVVFQDNIATGQAPTAQFISSGNIITVGTTGVVRVSPLANCTTIRLDAGTGPGQQVWIVNESSAFTIQFDVNTISKVADGPALPIPANTARKFVWDSGTNYWYRSA